MKKKKYKIYKFDPVSKKQYAGYIECFGKYELRQKLSDICNEKKVMFMVNTFD